MKIIFLDFDGVITTYQSRWAVDISKVSLLMKIVEKTNSKIVVTSSWKQGYYEVDNFKKSLFDEKIDKCSPLCYDCIEKDFELFKKFLDSIYGMTDNNGSWRGDEVERWLEEHEEEIESYVILDDDSDFREEQLFHFVQTDTYEGLTEREVKLAINVLNNVAVHNPIRLNLVLTTMWRNYWSGLVKDDKINQMLRNYRLEL